MTDLAVLPPTRVDRDRPLRVHVVGNSTVHLVEPWHGPRDGGTYAEQLVPLLADKGVPTAVTTASRWLGRVNECVARYERDVRDHQPDVLVLQFGIVECQSDLLPTWLVRHVGTWHRTSRPGTRLYRERLVPPAWRALRDYQRRAARHDAGTTHRLRPTRFVADLRRLVELARKDCGCLVLLVDIDEPGDRVEHWLPGTRERARRYNALLADVASAYDDAVRLVRASATLTDPATQLPDGMHRSVAGHALTASLLADEMLGWLKGGGQ